MTEETETIDEIREWRRSRRSAGHNSESDLLALGRLVEKRWLEDEARANTLSRLCPLGWVELQVEHHPGDSGPGGSTPQEPAHDRGNEGRHLDAAAEGLGGQHLVLLALMVGGLVIDPMCGSGTTLLAAQQSGRRFLGADCSEHAVVLARARLDSGTAEGEADL